MVRIIDTITANIFLGLREGYGEIIHSLNEVSNYLQDYVNRVGLCVKVTPTTFI